MNYAYVHCKPDGVPFYVGKGVRSRYKDFKYRNKYHKRVVAKYGQANILIGLLECSNNENALLLEVGLIKCFRRMGHKLTNLTDGGEGNVGWKCPEKVRKAVAKANRARVLSLEQRAVIGNLWRGKKRPEHSRVMRERGHWVGANNPWYGAGTRQLGVNNHMAKAVLGSHPKHGYKHWGTLQAAADDLSVTIQAISQAIRKKGRSKGWKLEHANGA